MSELMIASIYLSICWILALAAINTTDRTQEITFTILVFIFPLLLLPVLFLFTPKFNRIKN